MDGLKDILYNNYLDNRKQQKSTEINLTSSAFECYLEDHIIMNKSEKEKLSDLKSEYGTACLEEGFENGFYMALYAVKQILF